MAKKIPKRKPNCTSYRGRKYDIVSRELRKDIEKKERKK